MAGVRYIAKKGINFDGLKGKPRVEPGQPLPDNIPESTIKELLADGVIEEVKPEVKTLKGHFAEDGK